MEYLANLGSDVDGFENLVIKHTGRYYTHEFLAKQAIKHLLDELISNKFPKTTLEVIDPFAGDGRLLLWLIEEWLGRGFPKVKWSLHLWDLMGGVVDDSSGFLMKLHELKIDFQLSLIKGDSFRIAFENREKFDIVFTNPPWEMLKPDIREVKNLSLDSRLEYLKSLKKYDQWISKNYSLSRPKQKFAGWGTNLSRVGLEVSHSICRNDGYVLCVLPASFFADEQSGILRKKILSEYIPISISYYPAEAKLFGKADINSSTILYKKNIATNTPISITVFNKELEVVSVKVLEHSTLKANRYSISLTTTSEGLAILKSMSSRFGTWAEQEVRGDIWAGREIDETRIASRLEVSGSGPRFIKGKMIGRYSTVSCNLHTLIPSVKMLPPSVNYKKIVWRDVSRASQRRRLIATIVQEGSVAGNSLGVVYYRNGNEELLKGLLGIMNSFCFEFQLKSYLSTGHISLSALRKTSIPYREELIHHKRLIAAVTECLAAPSYYNEFVVEVIVAKDIYGLEVDDFIVVLQSFDKITVEETQTLTQMYRSLTPNNRKENK